MMSTMGPIVEGDFTQVQLDQIKKMIYEGINAVHAESSKNLQQASDELKQMATNVEQARAQQLQNMQTSSAQVDAQVKAIAEHLSVAQQQNQ